MKKLRPNLVEDILEISKKKGEKHHGRSTWRNWKIGSEKKFLKRRRMKKKWKKIIKKQRKNLITSPNLIIVSWNFFFDFFS